MTSIEDDFAPDRDALIEAVEAVVNSHRAPVDVRGAKVALSLPHTLPQRGLGGEEALRQLAYPLLDGSARLGHPGYFAQMDPPTPWMSWVGALWAAAFNQNLLHPDTAPVARDLERVVVRWLADPFGMRGGHLVPGSSVANLTALWVARDLRGITQVAASELSHLSVAKAARILGLKYVELQVDDDHRIQPEAVGELDLERTALVLTAGTVASGAVDRLDIGAAAAWRHVDAAWGGPLRFSRRHRARLEGVQHADSVSVSAHKLLFQPKECAAVLFAEPKEAHDTISFGGGYISVPNIGLLGSHGATALPLAASLLAWGRDGIEQLIDHTMSLAERLADIVEATDELELWRRPTTGVLLWRPTRVSPMEAHRKLCGAHVSLTNVRGEQWLRSVAANPNADPDLVAAQVLAAAQPD